jgi:hypothetical protein
MVGAKDRFADHRTFAGPCHDVTPWSSKKQSALCQATLSIGPYLLLEGPAPTRRSYPRALGLNAFGETNSKCLSLASWPTKMRAGSISMPCSLRSRAYSLTNAIDCEHLYGLLVGGRCLHLLRGTGRRVVPVHLSALLSP